MIISFATGLIQFCELVLCAGGSGQRRNFNFHPPVLSACLLAVLGLMEHPAVSKAMQTNSVMMIENPDLISPSRRWLQDNAERVPIFF